MKKYLPALLLAGLLCGCGQNPLSETTPPESTAMFPDTPSGLYAASELEQQTKGAVRTYPLPINDARDLSCFDDGLLLLSGEETTLTLLTGENLQVSASRDLGVSLSFQDPSFQIHGNALSYFDGINQETVVLDKALQPVSHIPAPDGLSGAPVLSHDRNTLYYCTSTALLALDLESGIHRTIKEMAYPGQTVADLQDQDTVIQCTADGRSLFIAADTGRLVEDWAGAIEVVTEEDTFCASFPMGYETALVFGRDAEMQILIPETEAAEHTFLPGRLLSVFQTEEAEIAMDLYDLETGLRQSQLRIPSGMLPKSVAADREFVWILTEDPAFGCDVIYRWEPAKMPINDGTDYTSPYFPVPGESDLAQCRALAEEIGAAHGIEILIAKDAVKAQPWDYDLEAEIQPAILLKELTQLQQRLSVYPEGMLSDTAANFSSLNLCLVRSVTGSPESGSMLPATGTQFLDGSDAYAVIAVGRHGEQALYHELFHILQTHIFNHSIAFDQWNTLNPAGFQYDYSYSANAVRDSGIYLQQASRSFIDTYSMSFPAEDRARVMEYAMLPGQRDLFASEPMQAKLLTLCQGIRKAYGLEKSPEEYRWEQYLKKSLAYSQ